MSKPTLVSTLRLLPSVFRTDSLMSHCWNEEGAPLQLWRRRRRGGIRSLDTERL